jgi:Protein of unknown function (DUF3300)
MDSIQRLRTRAQANGKLQTTKEQTVTVKTEDQKQYVVIEPTSPTEIYVPYYEPAAVYGDWPNPDYAPYYFPPPYGYIPGAALATGVAFAAGVAVRHAFWGNCDWGRGNINVVANRSVDIATSIAGSGSTTQITVRASPLQVIVTGPRQVIAIDPAQVVEIDPARVIETGRKLATLARARRVRNRPRKLVLKQARRRVSSQVRRRSSGRASRSATPLLQMSSQAPRLTLKPIVAARASAAAEERPAWPRLVAEERPGWVAEERPVWPRPVAEDEPAVAGGPILRLSTTSPFSAI